MRHAAYSQAASHPHSRAAPAPVSSAWTANPLPASAHGAAGGGAGAHSSAYPPLGAQPQAHAHAASARDAALAGHGAVASASTALDRVLAMLDGFEDDMDCPLCLEEMDLSDLNFRPCPCGYQICRFCYHHIKENTNNRCPACRTPYDDATVEFKAIKPDEMKRLQAAKKLRDKRRKDAELAMQNKATVRVRMRSQVHITGMTTRQANEDTLAQLKDQEHFGRYGKITKLFMSKRSPSASQQGSFHPVYQPVNVYVNYRTPAEASHCIAATDGTLSVEGNKLRAVWGTTRYCPNYLKGIRCPDHNCTFAHEPGDEIEGPLPSTKDEIFTYDSETVAKPRTTTAATATKKQPEVSLPATASWASKNAPPPPSSPIILNPHLPPLSATLPKPPPPQRSVSTSKPQTHPLPARPSSRAKQAAAAAATAATASSPSAPSSPSASAAQLPAASVDEARVPRRASEHPAEPSPDPVASTSRSPSPVPVVAAVPAPSGAFDPFAVFSSQPLHGLVEAPSVPSFPDFEFGDGVFDFSLDPDVKGKGRAVAQEEPTPFRDFANFEGFGRPAEAHEAAPSPFSASSYMGSFDPFAETSFSAGGSNDLRSDSPTPPSTAGADEMSRRSSRFGFARRESSSSHAMPSGKVGELLSAAARSAFGPAAGGRDGSPNGLPSPGAPFAPPGIAAPSRSASGVFNSLPPLGHDLGAGAGGTPSLAPAFPPGVLRSLASPNGSTTSSPQLSPRSRGAALPPHPQHQQHHYGPLPPGLGGSIGLNGGVANSALPPPPGLMPGRGAPIPAASFPLPPPAPRQTQPGAGSGASNTVAKEDLLALIAAAQASASKQPQQQPQPSSQDPHPFFSDPAILNARLASTGASSADAQLPPFGSALPQQQTQSPFPPGMRLPFQLQQQPQPPQMQQAPGLYRPMN
ncbi:hypothetical protein Rhopal_004351-T1 [Rhodotorula paludigena]|uniref:RING-type domain-containing protein n=1 Tax=Rhodotorula paludigena TaxID=86838 RepID=A0AAV5GN62_9BASI|nr:hypothetical protein Rhopal_004351-T1 [Rhodotorula paludigena]